MKRGTTTGQVVAKRRCLRYFDAHLCQTTPYTVRMSRGTPGLTKNPSTRLDPLPIGTKVDVIGGVHRGQKAAILGHTPKMYNVQLLGGRITVVKRENVREIPPLSEPLPTPNETDLYRKLIELEMAKIQESMQVITALLDKMNLNQQCTLPK